MNAKVLILMGSDSDLPVMEAAAKMLDEFKREGEMVVYQKLERV